MPTMHHRLLILGSEYWMGFALALPEGASFSEEKATKASSSRARVPLKGKGRLLTALGFRALFRTKAGSTSCHWDQSSVPRDNGI